MKFNCNLLFLFLLFACCKSAKELNFNSNNSLNTKENIKDKLQFWYQKDYILDSIPGISLDKWYNLKTKKPKSKNIIVAVIDTQIDKKHEDLHDEIWINPKEIANNGLDDDHNGYIDDINGWNFTGTQNGGYIVWGNFEYVRLVRTWSPLFKDKTENEISFRDLQNFKQYLRALKILDEKTIYYKNLLKITKHCMTTYALAKDSLKHYFPKEDYTYQQLDSMYRKHKINNKTFGQRSDDNDIDFGALIDGMMVNFEVNQKSFDQIKENEAQSDSIVNKNLNLNFNERIYIGDNPEILEKGYGTSNISINKEGYRNIQNHSTKVSGIIIANRNNNIGIKGIADNAKIMPLSISFSGDEHDKDITMAIRYAVDNGAKVINMSFGKEFSLNKEWVFEAFKYAEEHNVLIVHSSGNNHFNIDKNPYYPNDTSFDGSKEVSGNFINVGSISSKLDSTFVSSFSNYGKKNVDLFAPGEKIYTTSPNNNYEFDSGTSLAGPMVSGTAALIWSYYPKLTATEVKQIILDSGTAYDLEVLVPGGEGKKVPFSELSKSGKVLNVHNAMQLAEKVSKKR